MNKRLLWADSLKGVLILLVILGHAIQRVLVDECFSNHIWNIIYSFHMPAFMAISGYLTYGKEKVWNKRDSNNSDPAGIIRDLYGLHTSALRTEP